MLIGKAGSASTSISTADASSVTVRGRDLCSELMGKIGFTGYFFLLVTGRMPTEREAHFLDMVLVAIAEHGLVPTNQAARMTYAADPGVLQAAVAAGILGCGSVVLGTSEAAGQFLREAAREIAGAKDEDEALKAHVARIRASGGRVPGFGHPLHQPVDPRAQRILSEAETWGAGPHVRLARRAERAVPEVWGKPLPMNVSLAIAAVLLDMEFPATMLKAIPILARTASLLAHLAEEAEQPIGFFMASKAEEAIRYRPQEG